MYLCKEHHIYNIYKKKLSVEGKELNIDQSKQSRVASSQCNIEV